MPPHFSLSPLPHFIDHVVYSHFPNHFDLQEHVPWFAIKMWKYFTFTFYFGIYFILDEVLSIHLYTYLASVIIKRIPLRVSLVALFSFAYKTYLLQIVYEYMNGCIFGIELKKHMFFTYEWAAFLRNTCDSTYNNCCIFLPMFFIEPIFCLNKMSKFCRVVIFFVGVWYKLSTAQLRLHFDDYTYKSFFFATVGAIVYKLVE